MPPRTPEQHRIASAAGARKSWAQTEDRSARTAKARAARDQKFLDQAGGDPVKAEHLRRAFYLQMQLKSLKARQAKAEARKVAEMPP